MSATFNGGSHHFNFNDANFTSSQGSGPSLDALFKYICAASIHDSSDRHDAPKCHEDTRVAIQQEAVTWLKLGDGEDSKQMRWISGPAGAGKSAIMGSVAETLHKDDLLAASFFFSATSSNVNRQFKRFFIHTLAYQLAQHPTLRGCLRSPILAAANSYPELPEKNLNSQAELLILKPIRQALEEDRTNWPKAIVVDGLDECRVEPEVEPDLTVHANVRKRTDGDDQLEVLRVLSKLALDPGFPFRILIASRPDPAIYDYFEGEGREKAIVTLLDHTYSPDKDIALYLEAMFADIRRRYNLDPSWPAHNVVPTLVTNASGQFAYPSVIMRFIDDQEKSESPVALLEIVMRAASSGLLSSTTNPLAALDAMYTAIICSTPNPFLCVTWIQTIRWAQQVNSTLYAQYNNEIYNNEIFEEHPGEADKVLAPLRSLIKLAPGRPFDKYSFYHKSFLDYLDDPTRIGTLYVGRGEESMPNDPNLRFQYFVARRFLRVLSRNPTGNGLGSPIYPSTIHELWAPILWQNPRWLISEESDLLQIDVQEWVAKRRYVSWIHDIYTDVHAMCTVFRCTPVCKHWRLGIRKGWGIKVTDLSFLGRLFGRKVVKEWNRGTHFVIF